MKAKDYIAKYQEQLLSQSEDSVFTAVKSILSEMLDEVKAVAKTRNVQLIRGLVPILKEQNQKWNAIANRFEGTLKRDGFIEIVKTTIYPEIANYL